MRCGHNSKCLWPSLILISLYKQLAPHLKIGVHKSNTVYDFNTIWAVAAAITVQLDTLYIIYSCQYSIYYFRSMVRAKKVHVLYKRNAYENETPTVRGLAAGNNNMRSVLMVNMETI